MNAKELRKLMPQNAQDAEAARPLVALGYPALKPICRDMLRRVKDYKSPVADIICDFFASVGEPVADEVAYALFWLKPSALKYKVVSNIVARWPKPAVERVAPALQMLVTHTDFFNTDLLCIELLAKHGLSEKEWFKDWLKFKRDRLENYLAQATELEKVLA